MLYVSSVSSKPVADMRWSPLEVPAGGSGELRQVWISALPGKGNFDNYVMRKYISYLIAIFLTNPQILINLSKL